MTLDRFIWRVKEKVIEIVFQKVRIFFYSFLSNITIKANKNQPVLANGSGKIIIGRNVSFGVIYAPYYYSQYSYLNAREKESYIEIGDNCCINNSIVIVSDGRNITIGKNCLIGSTCQIIDSDFHEIDPINRFGGKNINKEDVTISENVFIGNNVTILKGVVIGKNSVIGNNSVVTKSIPANVIAAGNPARVIKSL